MAKTNEQIFSELLELKLGSFWDRALTIFRDYGPNLQYDVANVLLHAVDKEKVNKVLDILEEHYKNHLKYQHPELRGMTSDRFLGINQTQVMFDCICQQVLELQPNSVKGTGNGLT